METPKNILNQFNINPKPKVDEAYFIDFSKKLTLTIEPKKSNLFVRYRGFILWTSSAAALIFLVFTFNFFLEKAEPNFSQLSKNDIHHYLVQHLDDLEDESLLTKHSNTSNTTSQLSKDEILDYLENEEEIDVEF